MDDSKSIGRLASKSLAPKMKGIQQLAVLHAIRHPTTGKQILDEARKEAPKISYADLRQIVRSFGKAGLLHCINPEQQTGRVYTLTPKGIAAAHSHFEDFEYSCPKQKIDWSAYASIARSKSLRVTLDAFRSPLLGHDRRTPTQIRKRLTTGHSISMSFLIGAIRRLEKMGLVARKQSVSVDDRLAFYSITPKGRIIAEQFRDN